MGEKMVSWELFRDLYETSCNALERIGNLSRMTTDGDAIAVMDIADDVIDSRQRKIDALWEKAGGQT